MPTAHISADLDKKLLDAGFSWYADQEMYVIGIPLEDSEEIQPLCAVPRNGSLFLTSCIGNRQELEVGFLEGARVDNDGLSLDVIAGLVNLRDSGTPFEDIQDVRVVLRDSIIHARYVAVVDQKLTRNRARFFELIDTFNPIYKDSESLTHEQAPWMIGLLKETMDLRPIQPIWQQLFGAALGFEQWQWANGSTALGTQPWSPVCRFFREYGAERGWTLE